jgi:hypothetical protein
VWWELHFVHAFGFHAPPEARAKLDSHWGDLVPVAVRVDFATGAVMSTRFGPTKWVVATDHDVLPPSELELKVVESLRQSGVEPLYPLRSSTKGEGAHPVVLTASGSHHAYAECGVHEQPGNAAEAKILPHDHTSADGKVWWPSRVVSLGTTSVDNTSGSSSSSTGSPALEAFALSRYHGRWGHLGRQGVAPLAEQAWWA